MADPQTEAALRRLEALASGKGSGTPADPQTETALSQLEAMAKQSTPPAPAPPPPVRPEPSPSTYHRNPHVAVAPGGRVIDPATGQPFPPRGQADPNAQGPAYAGAAEMAGNVGEALAPIEHFTTPHLVNPTLRFLAILANPVQQTVAEGAKGYRKGGVAGIIPGIEAGVPRIVHSLTQPEVARSDIGTNIGLKDPWARAGVDLAGNLAVDLATGKYVQAPLVGKLGELIPKGLQASGAADVPLPLVNKSLNQLAAEGVDVRKIHQAFGAATGRFAEIKREGEGYLQQAQQRVNNLKRAGVNIQGVGEGSGQPVNQIDELVSHYIEAGSGPRAKFASKADVLAAGDQIAQTPEQARLIRDYITQTAQDYSSTWDRIGRELERVGYLKPGTAAKMRGQYLPGMYHGLSHNPADIETWLDAASQMGGVNPKMVGMAEDLLARARGGFSNSGKARTLGTWQERVEHGGEFQASPLFAKSVRTQTGIGARIEAMQNIAADPSLVSQTRGPGKLILEGRQYGPAEGLYVQPRTKAAIDSLLTPERINTGPVGQLYRWWKNTVVAGSLPMVEHHSKYVLAMAEGRAAQEGVSFTPADLARGLKERATYLKGQGASPAVDALSKNTRAFDPDTGLMNELGSSLRSGLGIKSSTGRSLLRGNQKLADQTRKAITSIEQIVKIALTNKLMTKYSPEEAAQIAQEAISGTGPPGKALTAIERLGILPFVTSKARSLPKMAAIAATRPDILLRSTRFNTATATALGPEAEARQQLLENPDAGIPVPGMRDRDGRQIFLPKNPFELSPVGGLYDTFSQGMFGPYQRINDAFRNVRPTAHGGEQIVPPGSLPEWEAVLKRIEYAAPALGLGGTIANAATRLGRAQRGETQTGGPFREPETIGQAILGIAFGGFSQVPETQDETQRRVTANAARSMPDMAFALQYLGKLERGEEQANRSPWIERVRTPGEAAKQMKAAYRRLQDLVTGHEGGFALQDRQQRIKNQVDWFFQNEHRFMELSLHAPTLRDLEAASQ